MSKIVFADFGLAEAADILGLTIIGDILFPGSPRFSSRYLNQKIMSECVMIKPFIVEFRKRVRSLGGIK